MNASFGEWLAVCCGRNLTAEDAQREEIRQETQVGLGCGEELPKGFS